MLGGARGATASLSSTGLTQRNIRFSIRNAASGWIRDCSVVFDVQVCVPVAKRRSGATCTWDTRMRRSAPAEKTLICV